MVPISRLRSWGLEVLGDCLAWMGDGAEGWGNGNHYIGFPFTLALYEIEVAVSAAAGCGLVEVGCGGGVGGLFDLGDGDGGRGVGADIGCVEVRQGYVLIEVDGDVAGLFGGVFACFVEVVVAHSGAIL